VGTAPEAARAILHLTTADSIPLAVELRVAILREVVEQLQHVLERVQGGSSGAKHHRQHLRLDGLIARCLGARCCARTWRSRPWGARRPGDRARSRPVVAARQRLDGGGPIAVIARRPR